MHALLKDGIFKPRAVTRNAKSESARNLAELGCEIAEADLGDKEAVKKAVTGAECVFLVCCSIAIDSCKMLKGMRAGNASLHAAVGGRAGNQRRQREQGGRRQILRLQVCIFRSRRRCLLD